MTNTILLDSYRLFEHFVLVWLRNNIFPFYFCIREIFRMKKIAQIKIYWLKHNIYFMIGILSDSVFNRNLLQAPRTKNRYIIRHGNRLIPLTF